MNKFLKGTLMIAVIIALFSQQANAFFWNRKPKKESTSSPAVKEVKQQPAAEKKASAKKAAEPQKSAPVVQKLTEKQIKEERALREKKRAQLDGSMWDIKLIPMSGKGARKTDVLTFQDNHFKAEKTAKGKFKPTNYTITVKETGVTVWETMQSAGKGETVFWRGEIVPAMDSMRGVVSIQHKDGTSENYSFVSTNRKAVGK